MKYIGELSLAWLVILAFYAVIPATVDARALDADTFISEREAEENSPAENDEANMEDNLTISEDELYTIVEMALKTYLNERGAKGPRKTGASSLWYRPVDSLSNGFTGNYKRTLSNEVAARDYARTALKRNMRNELRSELAKKSYHSPVDMSGGGLLGQGLFSGVGR
ncbi:uncharacterized protein [Apostichopus japonicus]|uniref:uncharacterized protein n=1 Tax=Stichopus japonicus TaxID=307972 RepID=UPI003AB53C63